MTGYEYGRAVGALEYYAQRAREKNERLSAINAELLEALQAMVKFADLIGETRKVYPAQATRDKVRAAIALALAERAKS